jgi:hypothetical protein
MIKLVKEVHQVSGNRAAAYFSAIYDHETGVTHSYGFRQDFELRVASALEFEDLTDALDLLEELNPGENFFESNGEILSEYKNTPRVLYFFAEIKHVQERD